MPKILIIEDDRTLVDDLIEFFTFEGFEVKSAANGLQGVETAKTYLPDVILCDVSMPELDGYGVLENLQNDSNTQTIPFIFLSGEANDSPSESQRHGARAFLRKPCNMAQVLVTINKHLP